MKWLIPLIAMFCILGCSSTVSKTNLLSPGMTTEQVKAILGTPLRTDFREGQLVWVYMLTYSGGMGLPYYLHFDRESKKLEAWYGDEQEAQRQREVFAAQMLQIMQQQQPQKVNVRVSP